MSHNQSPLSATKASSCVSKLVFLSRIGDNRPGQEPTTERNDDFLFLVVRVAIQSETEQSLAFLSSISSSTPRTTPGNFERRRPGVRIGRPVNSGANGKRENKTMNLHKGKLCRILFEATHGTSATTMRIRTARAIAPNEN